jgi:iron uptake system component EfeO
MKRFMCLPLFATFVLGCSDSNGTSAKTTQPQTDAQFQEAVVTGMHDSLLAQIKTLHAAAIDLANAAPSAARGWDATMDAAAIQSMETAWTTARSAYEQIEGATAPLFPDVDTEIDARYDDFLTTLGAAGDQDLFDDQGVTGMHAIERILYQPETPASVIAFESSLPGYKAAAWPATAGETSEFKNKLCARLVTDTQTFMDEWQPQAIDVGGSFQGLVSLMNEQREKVIKAASFEEESRYSQTTMGDIRNNLTGTKNVYALFQPWLATKSGGPALDDSVDGGFTTLATDYGTVTGDAIPEPPSTWSAESPSMADLDTPFGKLYTAVNQAVDPTISGSVVDSMNKVAVKLGFPQFTE